MSALSHQRCFHHPEREAIARCPECRRFFCRECITEHEERVICASCLRHQHPQHARGRGTLPGLLRLSQFALGLLAAWFFFYLVGELLLQMPSSFHDGTLWQAPWLLEP